MKEEKDKLKLPKNCHCGKPMHLSAGQLVLLNMMYEKWGDDKKVIVIDREGGKVAYLVPTYYIIIHGIKAKDISRLGFPVIPV